MAHPKLSELGRQGEEGEDRNLWEMVSALRGLGGEGWGRAGMKISEEWSYLPVWRAHCLKERASVNKKWQGSERLQSAKGATEEEMTEPEGTKEGFRQEMIYRLGQRMNHCWIDERGWVLRWGNCICKGTEARLTKAVIFVAPASFKDRSLPKLLSSAVEPGRRQFRPTSPSPFLASPSPATAAAFVLGSS